MTGESQGGERVTGPRRDARTGTPSRWTTHLRRRRKQERVERGPADGRRQHGQDRGAETIVKRLFDWGTAN